MLAHTSAIAAPSGSSRNWLARRETGGAEMAIVLARERRMSERVNAGAHGYRSDV